MENSIDRFSKSLVGPNTTRGVPASLSISADGKILAYPSRNNIVLLSLDDLSNLEYEIYDGHSSTVTALAFSPKGRVVASGDEHGELIVWSKGKDCFIEVFRSTVLNGPIRSIGFSFDGERGVAVGENNTNMGYTFSVKLKKLDRKVQGHTGPLFAACFNKKRPMKLFTGGIDVKLGLHKGPPFQNEKILDHHSKTIYAASASPDERYVATAGSDFSVRKILKTDCAI